MGVVNFKAPKTKITFEKHFVIQQEQILTSESTEGRQPINKIRNQAASIISNKILNRQAQNNN